MQPKNEGWIAGVAAGLTMAVAVSGAPAQAQDFFSALFGGFTMPRHAPSLPFAEPGFDNGAPPQRRAAAGPAKAYCVRTCDGRYFPLGATGGDSKAEMCHSLCPASATRVVFGHDIDSATTDSGKPYSALPNAFRYRTELVNGCTCNGKTPGGLAHIDIKDDPTLRKGDLIATADGTLVANGAKASRLSQKVSPARTERAASRFATIPVMAAQ
ncbi:hypothetical protein AFEL58S_00559 [Afipia felis]